MPKRRKLEQRIRRLAKDFGRNARPVRQGNHEIWECGGLRFPIPRHTEINEWTARTIIVKLTKHLENLAEEEAP